MGFEFPEDHYKLTFQGVPGMDGLEVVMLPMSVGTALKLQELQEKKPTGKEDRQDVWDMMQLAADHIVSWNLERGGQPVPVCLDEVQKLRSATYRRIVREWDLAGTGVSAPLDDGSTSGDSLPEVFVPMEPSSPSLSS